MRIKVTSPSFSRDETLVEALRAVFPDSAVRSPDDRGDLTDRDALAAYLADADGVVLGLEPLDDSVLARCPRLKVVAKYGVGLDNIDLSACRARGIHVGWTPGVNRRSVAELALGAALVLMHDAYRTATLLSGGTWCKQGGVLLSGKTVGIVGVGNIGRDLVGLLAPFGCPILGCDIVDQSAWFAAHGVEAVDLPTLLRDSDVVTLHVPLTPLTHHMIDAAALRAMKPTAVLINTSRGPVVSREALKQALGEGWIAAAAMDVHDGPEPPEDRAYLALPTLMPTPHIGGSSREAIRAMGQSAIDHLRAWRDGAPLPSVPDMLP